MWRKELLNAERIAFDIEISGSGELLCVAFAAHSSRAWVFPATAMEDISYILESSAPKIAQNGQFDLYFLRTRCGVEVQNYSDDTIVAWHACYPELAGAPQDKKGAKRTRKGLAFLASLVTTDEWWKEYETDEAGMYELCGRDACITLDVMNWLDGEIDRLDVRDIYEHQMRLIWPCIEMQERGLRIDEQTRSGAAAEIDRRVESIQHKIVPQARRLFSARQPDVPRQTLFWQRSTCPCCRGGTRKREACWSCAGFDEAPGMKELEALAIRRAITLNTRMKKAELEDVLLKPCEACDGVGKWESFEFNPNSEVQQKILLYDVLKLPERMKDGKRTTDEDALKALLAKVEATT